MLGAPGQPRRESRAYSSHADLAGRGRLVGRGGSAVERLGRERCARDGDQQCEQRCPEHGSGEADNEAGPGERSRAPGAVPRATRCTPLLHAHASSGRGGRALLPRRARGLLEPGGKIADGKQRTAGNHDRGVGRDVLLADPRPRAQLPARGQCRLRPGGVCVLPDDQPSAAASRWAAPDGSRSAAAARSRRRTASAIHP